MACNKYKYSSLFLLMVPLGDYSSCPFCPGILLCKFLVWAHIDIKWFITMLRSYFYFPRNFLSWPYWLLNLFWHSCLNITNSIGWFLFWWSLEFLFWHAAKLFSLLHWFQNCFCFRSRTFPSHVGIFFRTPVDGTRSRNPEMQNPKIWKALKIWSLCCQHISGSSFRFWDMANGSHIHNSFFFKSLVILSPADLR